MPKDDGSVQIITVIDGTDSPTRYEYSVSVPRGGHLKLDDSGIVVIYGKINEFSGGIAPRIAPAWAKDANGVNVPSYFEVKGRTVTQVVDHRHVSVVYPVTADPWLGRDLFRAVSTGTFSNQPKGLSV